MAIACRSPWGPMSGAPSTRPTARCTMRRTMRGSIRSPSRSPRNSAARDRVVTSSGRRSSQRSRALRAGVPIGTVRSLSPLPSTRSVCRASSMASMSSPHTSETRMPLAYSTSRMATSRAPRAESSSAAVAMTERSISAVSAWLSVSGSRLGGRGDLRARAGSVGTRPCSCAQAKHPRTDAALRAIDVFSAPASARLPSHDRSARRSICVASSWPFATSQASSALRSPA